MSTEHKRPLAAFVAVSLLCAVLLGLAVVRSHAVLNLGNLPLLVAPPAPFDLFGPEQQPLAEEPAQAPQAAPRPVAPEPGDDDVSVPSDPSVVATQVAGASGTGAAAGTAGVAPAATTSAPTTPVVATPAVSAPAAAPSPAPQASEARGRSQQSPGHTRPERARKDGAERGPKTVAARTAVTTQAPTQAPGASAEAHAAAPGQAKKDD